eukprot:9090467-Pyramimonas_sp.AAC.1
MALTPSELPEPIAEGWESWRLGRMPCPSGDEDRPCASNRPCILHAGIEPRPHLARPPPHCPPNSVHACSGQRGPCHGPVVIGIGQTILDRNDLHPEGLGNVERSNFIA